MPKHRCLVVWFALLLPCLSLAQRDPAAENRKFREEHLAAAKDPRGYLALVALQWLAEGDTAVGSATGNKLRLEHLPPNAFIVRQHAGKASLVAPTGGFAPCLRIDGKPATATELASDETDHPTHIACGGVDSTVIARGDWLYLRVRDAKSPTLQSFHGLNWYPFQPAYRITANWVPYSTEHTLPIRNVLGQDTPMKTPGYAEFQVDGRSVRLEPSAEGDGLWFIFRDTTSRSETYGAGRFMAAELPNNGIGKPGKVILDFNQAYNPPCAYTAFATCPLPPPGNRLDVAIPAGEKRYHE